MKTDKHIWEGWTVQDFIDELEPSFNAAQRQDNFCWQGGFKDKKEVRDWCKSNQPYYKKHIPEVAKYFYNKSNLK